MSKRQAICMLILTIMVVLTVGCGLFTKKYTLIVSTNGEGIVSISPTGGQYKSGTKVHLTATPKTNWIFDHWSGDTTDSNPTITVVMDTSKHFTAHFVPLEYEVNVTMEGMGTVFQTLVTTPQEAYTSDQLVQLTAVADNGWSFIEWQGDITGSINPQTITVNKEYNIKAVFSKNSDIEWNFLVYLNGDNNLEMCAISDFNEMEEVGSTQDVNILVLFDRNPSYDSSNDDWSGTRLYRVTRDEDKSNDIISELVYDYGELDMSDPQVLENFLLTCQIIYPAERTILTLWDHGDGIYPKTINRDNNESITDLQPITPEGICWDDTTGIDPWCCLTTDEIASALLNVRQITGKKIEIINMDACLMQTLEVAYEWRNEVSYLVGSQGKVPGDGNDYTTLLTGLKNNPVSTALELAQTLVDDYYNYYSVYGPGWETYSAVNLGVEFDDLITTFKSFATAMYQTTDMDGVYSSWNNVTSFTERQYVDLYDLARKLITNSQDTHVVNEAITLQHAIENVIANHNETSKYQGKAFGLSIFLPSCSEWPDYSGANQYISFLLSQDTDWDEFILRFIDYTDSATAETLLNIEMIWPSEDCDLGIWEPDNNYYWIDEGSSPNGIFSENMINGGTESWTIKACYNAGFYSPLVYSSDYTGNVQFNLSFEDETFDLSINVEPGVIYIVYDFEIIYVQGIPQLTFKIREDLF